MEGTPLQSSPFIHGDYYKFDACSASEQECHERVSSCWNAPHLTTLEKLSIFGNSLHSWQRKRRHSSSKRILHLQKVVHNLMAGPLSSSKDLHLLVESEAELKDLIDKDEAHWS
ncbi:hypothetical protein V6N13_133800 [Hibiscus sabdariffa]